LTGQRQDDGCRTSSARTAFTPLPEGKKKEAAAIDDDRSGALSSSFHASRATRPGPGSFIAPGEEGTGRHEFTTKQP